MNLNAADLCSLSKNKYKINLLETIEHKELFKNININLYKINNKKNNSYKKTENYNNFDNDYYIINDENSNSIEINNEKEYFKKNMTPNDSTEKMIKKTKKSSKSFNNIIKNNDKFCIENDLFTKSSQETKKKCLTQDNDSQSKENNNIKIKNESKNFSDENTNINKGNNNITPVNELKDNIYYYSNDFKRNNKNICYFNKWQNKESKNSINTYNNHNDKGNLDVYNRLYNKSYYNKKKNNINEKEENDCTFNPQLLSNYKAKKNIDLLANFIERQEKFNKYINQKKINLKKDINRKESRKYTFTPNTSCTSNSKYSIKLEAERQEESNLDKANRMVYDSVKKIEDKNNHLFLMYNTQYSFIPSINKNNKYKINNKESNYIIRKKERKEKRNEKKKEIENKYINHEYDNIKSNYKKDKELMNRINEEYKKRIKKINNIRRENEDYDSCTFKPEINKNNNLYFINFKNNNINLNKKKTYVDFYNKKKYYKNKLNHSQSCSRNNWYIKSSINNNNGYNKNDIFYNTDFEYGNYYDYNNINNYYNNIEYEKEFNDIKFNNYNNNSEEKEEFIDYERYYRESQNSNNSYNNYQKKNNYNIITPNETYYKNNKLKVMHEIKKEDKKNFLLINKLLYN